MPVARIHYAVLLGLLAAGSVAIVDDTAARAESRGNALLDIWRSVQAELERATEANVPDLVVPKPRTVVWSPKRIARCKVPSEVLALAAGDLDADGRDELVVLAQDRLVVFARSPGAGAKSGVACRFSVESDLQLVAEAVFTGKFARVQPRDPVGTLALAPSGPGGTGAVLHLRSSAYAHGFSYSFRDSVLKKLGDVADFPACNGVTISLAAGRNYFSGQPKIAVEHADMRSLLTAIPSEYLGAKCNLGLRDSVGRQRLVLGLVGVDGKLAIREISRCGRRDQACRAAPPLQRDIAGVGDSFDVLDYDGDGRVDVITSSSAVPGGGDRVVVWRQRGQRVQKVYSRDFGGGVVGLTHWWDGGRQLVIVAVRLVGSRRVSFWSLN